MKHYIEIELDDDPIRVNCMVEYHIRKSFQSHEFGERVLIDIEDIRLFCVIQIIVNVFGVEVEIGVSNEIEKKIRRQVHLETEEITEQILRELDYVSIE